MTAPQTDSPNVPFWGYQDLAYFVAMVLPSLVLGVIVVHFLSKLAPAFFAGKVMFALAAQFLAYGFLFLSLFALLRLRYDRPFWRSLAWVVPHPVAWGVVFAGPFLAIAVSLAGTALRAPSIPLPFEDLLRSRAMIVFMGAFVVLLGPLFEELMFRGFFMPLFMRTFGPWPGILLAALPFALLHGPQYLWSWQQVSLVFVAGTVFGWIRYRTGSTFASALMHASYNLTFFVGLLMQTGRMHM